jgi:hypothetical protein
MQDKNELEERFARAQAKTDDFIDRAAKDLATGKIDEIEFKLALSGAFARVVNVESLLAIAAELTYRAAMDKVVAEKAPKIELP